jgi:hypothetical protein
MNHSHISLTRREALLSALKVSLTTAVAAPIIVQAAPPTHALMAEPEFVLENDYPFFGGELPEGYRQWQ